MFGGVPRYWPLHLAAKVHILTEILAILGQEITRVEHQHIGPRLPDDCKYELSLLCKKNAVKRSTDLSDKSSDGDSKKV